MVFPLFIPVREIPGVDIHLEAVRFSGGCPGHCDAEKPAHREMKLMMSPISVV